VKLLKHKANERIRLLMRQEKTLKIRANHIGECAAVWVSGGHLGCACGKLRQRQQRLHPTNPTQNQPVISTTTQPPPNHHPTTHQPPTNHPPTVMPGTKLQEHAGSDKAWVWSTVDFSEGEQKVELFCMRFGSAESESTLDRGRWGGPWGLLG